jgi:N-acetylneuraminic acid mutarotase
MGLMRTETGAAFAAGRLYVIGGGLAMAESSSLVQEYDPRTDRWRERAPLPQGRDYAPTVVADGKIHVLGGRFDATTDNTDVHSVYDPATNSWSSAPFLPEPRSGGSAVLYHDRILNSGFRVRDAGFEENF